MGIKKNTTGDFTKIKSGRPSTYKAEYADELIEFFSGSVYVEREVNGEVVQEKRTFPTFERFAVERGVTANKLWEWAQINPDFSKAYEKAQNLQKTILVEGTINGAWKEGFAIFLAKCSMGMQDKTIVEQTGKDGAPMQVEVAAKVSLDFADIVSRVKK